MAGLRAVESFRTGGFDGEITVIAAEPHPPYDRPPLSKRLLSGQWGPDRIALRKPDDLADLDVEWRSGVVATGLDTERREVALADGDRVGFDGAILATGATPRHLPDEAAHGHVSVLRTIDDALTLRRSLAGGDKRVVVIGAGFVGLEVAATARQLGNEVVVIEAGPAPLMRGLGAEMGAAVAAVHADHGVDIRCRVSVDGFAPGTVLIDGGWHEPADVVVVGVGVVPNTDWLAGSGLEVRDGLVCSESLNVGVPLVYAAGDMVRWHNPLFGTEMRVEHWTNAAEQGAAAATNLLSESMGQPTKAYEAVPFFWSEQFDRRIQFLGHADPSDQVEIIAGSVEDRRFAALYGHGDRFHGVLGVNMPRHVMPFRELLMSRASWQQARDHAAAL